MGLLTPTDKEYSILSDMYNEGFSLVGQDSLYYPVVAYTEDINRDKDIKYGEPIKISLLFEDDPKPKMKKYQWITEDDNLPIIASIGFKSKEDMVGIKDISADSMIEILHQYQMNDSKKFIISRVRGSSINPLWWDVQLVPYRESIYEPVKEVKPLSTGNFLNRRKP